MPPLSTIPNWDLRSICKTIADADIPIEKLDQDIINNLKKSFYDVNYNRNKLEFTLTKSFLQEHTPVLLQYASWSHSNEKLW